MRLFTAIQFSPEVKRELTEIIEAFSHAAEQGNFTRPENLHLTLVFIGESEKVELIKQCMDAVNTGPFVMRIKNSGCFKRREGDIYWLGIENNAKLFQVQADLQASLLQNGFEIEERAYKPHLTLGRKVVLPPRFDHSTLIGKIQQISIPVEKISLMQSERIKGRLIYTEVYSKSLVGLGKL